jgi:ABC-type transport system involved in cytochrome bd biosynthesis fused ATPase/permease subunit
MDQGQVVEAGTHEHLLARQGAYAELVHAQSAVGESADGGPVRLWATHAPTA